MSKQRRIQRPSLQNLMRQVDAQTPGAPSPDTVPTGFPSIDRLLGGGLRRRDLIVVGGDVGVGKSAFALALALRTAHAGHTVVFFSGEMDEDRLLERALAIEGRAKIDDLRSATLTEERRAAIGAAAIKLRDLPLVVYPLTGEGVDEVLEPAWGHQPALLVVDYLQLLPPPRSRSTRDEDAAETLRTLKALALSRHIACLTVAQLGVPRTARSDRRPNLDDYGTLGAVKQHADIILSLYREEMDNPGGGVEGATELIVNKNRNGPTGFVDLYFYQQWMRFEDMLDPDR
ncbi:MAG: DnaB helicase C-terminal domain-containing protein [Gemmatimonadota bacterium]|nr:DnaB helicase C-terminal domain-containing protein [Gemmatimonadota bacterium]